FATIGMQCLQGAHPFRSIFLVLSAGMWGALLLYLIFAAVRGPVRGLGGMLGPAGLLGLTLGVVMGPGAERQGEEFGRLLSVHVGLATLGLVGFVLASAVAGLYLGLDGRLRRRRSIPTRGGQSLQSLERLQYGLMAFVAPVFGLAVLTGVMVLSQAGPEVDFGRRAAELVAAGVAVVASVTVLVSRVAWGLRGRTAAIFTLVGLAAMTVIVISYGVRL
ncbi:MAG: cytochrome c biogenesis protein CcsA, partial [Nannocystaceae bacterium]